MNGPEALKDAELRRKATLVEAQEAMRKRLQQAEDDRLRTRQEALEEEQAAKQHRNRLRELELQKAEFEANKARVECEHAQAAYREWKKEVVPEGDVTPEGAADGDGEESVDD